MKIFNSVAQMKLATIKAGQYVETFGYYAKGDAGAARYLVVASQAADGYGDHTLANGTVAVLQVGGREVTASQLGATGTTDQSVIAKLVEMNRPFIDVPVQIESEVVRNVPYSISGLGSKSKIAVPSSATAPAFSTSATGGSTREKVRFEHLDFEGGNGTCIQATSTNPLELYDVRFNTGKEALKLSSFYYGSARDCIFLDSGVDANNLNNFDFVGTDANGAQAVASGRYLATDYAFTFTNCIGIQFSQMTFEIWKCNVFNFNGCNAVSFNRSWFELNDSERVFLLVDCANTSFNNGCQIDTTAAQPSDSFIQVANTSPSGTRQLKSAITFNTTNLVLRESPTASVNFVKTSDVAGAGKAQVNFNDCTLKAGFIHNPNLNTDMQITRMMLSSTSTGDPVDKKKGLTAIDTVDVSAGQPSSWTPNNANTEWDFTTGVGGWTEVVAAGSTVSVVTSMPVGAPKLTGTKALKVATVGAVTSRMNLTLSDVGAITSDGETYFIACKIWSNVNSTAKLRLLTNASVVADDSTTVAIGGTGWRWLVMKTNSTNMAGILASGLDPILRIDFITPSATNIYMDRADFQIDNGDHYLP